MLSGVAIILIALDARRARMLPLAKKPKAIIAGNLHECDNQFSILPADAAYAPTLRRCSGKPRAWLNVSGMPIYTFVQMCVCVRRVFFFFFFFLTRNIKSVWLCLQCAVGLFLCEGPHGAPCCAVLAPSLTHPPPPFVLGPFFAEEEVENFDVSSLQEEALRNIEADSFWCMSKLLDGIQVN